MFRSLCAATLVLATLTATAAHAEEKTLAARLGGIHGIATLVDDFVDRFSQDPRIAANTRLKAALSSGALSLPGIKFRYTELIAFLSEGLPVYTGSSLSQLRQQMTLTDEQVQAIQSALHAALEARRIGPADQKDLRDRLHAASAATFDDARKSYSQVALALSQGDTDAALPFLAADARISLLDGKTLSRDEFVAYTIKQIAGIEGFHIDFAVRPLMLEKESMTLRVSARYSGRLKAAGSKTHYFEGIDVSRDTLRLRAGRWLLTESTLETTTQTLDGKPMQP